MQVLGAVLLDGGLDRVREVYTRLFPVPDSIQQIIGGPLDGRQTRTRSDSLSTRFNTLAGAQDLFKYSDKGLQRASLPSPERLDEVEKIIGCLLHHMVSLPVCVRASALCSYRALLRF